MVRYLYPIFALLSTAEVQNQVEILEREMISQAAQQVLSIATRLKRFNSKQFGSECQTVWIQISPKEFDQDPNCLQRLNATRISNGLAGWLVGLILYVSVNSYGHVQMVSSPKHTFSWASLT